VKVFVHARRHGLIVLVGNMFAYHLRVQEAVTANAAMPLVANEDVRTPLGAFRVVFGIGHRLNNRSVAVEAQEKSPAEAGPSTVVMAEGKGASATRQFAVGEMVPVTCLLAKAPLPFSPSSFPVVDPVSEMRRYAELSRNGLNSDGLLPLFGQGAGMLYGCAMGKPYGGNYGQAPE
jgi:hypothetical protein